MKIIYFFLLYCTFSSFAQNSTKDSLRLELAKPHDDTTRLDILFNLAFNEVWDNADSAFQLAREGLLSSQKFGYLKGEAEFLITIGASYWLNGNYNAALKYDFEALPICERLDNDLLLWYCSIGLTTVFRDQKDYTQAVKYGKIIEKNCIENEKPELLRWSCSKSWFNLSRNEPIGFCKILFT